MTDEQVGRIMFVAAVLGFAPVWRWLFARLIYQGGYACGYLWRRVPQRLRHRIGHRAATR